MSVVRYADLRSDRPVSKLLKPFLRADRYGSRSTNLLNGRLHLMSTTIRVSERTRDRFAKLADTTGRPMTQLLDEAVDALERQVFFGQFSARYDELRTDPVAWAEVERERALESGVLHDTSA